jgi:SRSO17 transposase
MNVENASDWVQSLEEFFKPFEGYFVRSETRDNAQKYMRALLGDVERKNSWQLSEVLGLADPHPLQRMLREGKWEDKVVRCQLRAEVVEVMGTEQGIGVVDESGFVKWGEKSAGVSRQYCGRIGKVENCQVGVYLGYVTAESAAFLDCQLYLPQSWCEDRERCRAAQIPDDVTFQTKPQIAQAMLDQAWDEGVPMQWVTGDTLYGNSPHFRQAIQQRDRYYVLAIGAHHHVQPIPAPQAIALPTLAQTLPEIGWQRLCFRLGEKGPIWYDWQAIRVQMKNDTIGEQWLLLQRSVNDTADDKFYLSNAPSNTLLLDLVAVALSRHPIEDLFEEAKGEVGMADYEVRHWHSWHRHMTLVMLAHTWLKLIQLQHREKKSTTHLVELEPC